MSTSVFAENSEAELKYLKGEYQKVSETVRKLRDEERTLHSQLQESREVAQQLTVNLDKAVSGSLSALLQNPRTPRALCPVGFELVCGTSNR